MKFYLNDGNMYRFLYTNLQEERMWICDESVNCRTKATTTTKNREILRKIGIHNHRNRANIFKGMLECYKSRRFSESLWRTTAKRLDKYVKMEQKNFCNDRITYKSTLRRNFLVKILNEDNEKHKTDKEARILHEEHLNTNLSFCI
ncbi:hypothetical protein GWI33_017182 [Rhynchophorus ferrugineus]|uniref:FLYWCH-type domain-containing protein n=1 Tax=Rhynchophorus ferrugineus TaxID=354439 RepID=A0A834I0A2_RHYFE|nr:hypothetical protein GWI33_017182 [Rhynchophorus ferrugineus]